MTATVRHLSLIKNARLASGDVVDLTIKAGKIQKIQSAQSHPDPVELSPEDVLDLGQDLIIPGLIEGHCHLDKTFVGRPWQPHEAGPTVSDRIASERQMEQNLDYDVSERAAALLRLMIGQGSTVVRTHVDIDLECRLERFHSLLEVRERFKDWVTLQIVAFPQVGVMRCPGILDLLRVEIEEGAVRIGGIDPATIDGDVTGQLNALFDLADRTGAGLDLHLHNQGTVGIHELEQLALRTRSHGLAGKVTASHAMSLGTVPEDLARRTGASLAEAGVSVMTYGPGSIPLPPLKILRELGVVVFGGSDNIRDAWSPYGNGDMVERAMLLAYRSGFRRDEDLELAFDLITQVAAQGVGISDYGIHAGARADLVVVSAQTIPELVVRRPVRRWVIRGGQVVARDGLYLGTA